MKEITFIFKCILLSWSPDQRLIECFNLKVKPLASRPGNSDHHIALLNYNFAYTVRLFQGFKIFDVDYLKFTALQLGPTCRRNKESMDSLFPCNLGPSCTQEKHRNIKIYVHIRTDIVNLPLIVKPKSCLPCHPSYKSITSTWVLNLYSTSQNSGSLFKKKKAIIPKTTQIAQTVRHIGSPTLPHMPL